MEVWVGVMVVKRWTDRFLEEPVEDAGSHTNGRIEADENKPGFAESTRRFRRPLARAPSPPLRLVLGRMRTYP